MGAYEQNYLKISFLVVVIFSLMLYGCETWSLTLREECRLRVFESRILRRISEPKRDDNDEWRKLHNKELHSLYRSANIVSLVCRLMIMLIMK